MHTAHPNQGNTVHRQAEAGRGTAGLHAPRPKPRHLTPDGPRDLIKRDYSFHFHIGKPSSRFSPCPTEARHGRTAAPAPATRPPALPPITTCASRWPSPPRPAPIISSSSPSLKQSEIEDHRSRSPKAAALSPSIANCTSSIGPRSRRRRRRWTLSRASTSPRTSASGTPAKVSYSPTPPATEPIASLRYVLRVLSYLTL